MQAKAAIIRCKVNFVTGFFNFCLEDHQVFIAGSNDRNNVVSCLLQGLRNWKSDSGTYTSDYDHSSTLLISEALPSLPEHILDYLANLHGIQLICAFANSLNNQRDCACFKVRLD